MKGLLKLMLATVATTAMFWGTAASARAPYMAAGQFMTVTPRDPVEGMVKILPAPNGAHHLVLEADFKSSRGPDLFLVLHKEVVPRSYEPSNSFVIAPLRAFQGRQVYLIPANVDPAQFKAVIVWCKEFNVTFGSAALVPRSAFRF